MEFIYWVGIAKILFCEHVPITLNLLHYSWRRIIDVWLLSVEILLKEMWIKQHMAFCLTLINFYKEKSLESATSKVPVCLQHFWAELMVQFLHNTQACVVVQSFSVPALLTIKTFLKIKAESNSKLVFISCVITDSFASFWYPLLSLLFYTR